MSRRDWGRFLLVALLVGLASVNLFLWVFAGQNPWSMVAFLGCGALLVAVVSTA